MPRKNPTAPRALTIRYSLWTSSLETVGLRNGLMDYITAQAVIRYGLGRKLSEPVPASPLDWLQSQVRNADPARFEGLESSAQGITAWNEYEMQRKTNK